MADLYQYAAKVVRVIDGDTLLMEIDLGFNIRKTDYVRLFGVNAPETHGAHPVPAGAVATAFTQTWVDRGLPLWIRSHRYDEREKYGRILASVFADGDPQSLNDALLASGNAVKM